MGILNQPLRGATTPTPDPAVRLQAIRKGGTEVYPGERVILEAIEALSDPLVTEDDG